VATRRKAVARTDGRAAGIAAYAVVQSLMISLVETNVLSMIDGAAIIERAAANLRRRSSSFAAAAALLDQEAAFWRPAPRQ